MYEQYLKWSSVTASLVANRLATEKDVRELNVHYRFLSAFAHPHTDVTKLLYGRNAWNWPTYDHYSSELILLYTIVLAVEALRSFDEMIRRPPTVTVDGWDELAAICNRAWKISSHLWFPGQEPHQYDRHQEANRRGFCTRVADSDEPIPAPDALPATEIGYYTNPLERLVKMHLSLSELITGLTYHSPWERRDAQTR